mgnify:CR=1 FL=1
MHRTTDEGVTWEVISPDLTLNDPRGHEASGKPITRDVTGEEYWATLYAIRESPLERGVIWAGANDGPIHVTRDGGKTWTNVTKRLPNLPPWGSVRSIAPSRHAAGTAYLTRLSSTSLNRVDQCSSLATTATHASGSRSRTRMPSLRRHQR